MISPEAPNPPPWEPPGPDGPDSTGLVVCPVCKARIAAKAKKCPHCGEPLRKRTAARKRRMGCQMLMLALACGIGLSAYALLRYGASVEQRQARERERQQERQERMDWTAAEAITIGRNTLGCRRAEDLGRPERAVAPACVTLPAGASARVEAYDAGLGALRVRLAGSEDFWWMAAQGPAADDRRRTP